METQEHRTKAARKQDRDYQALDRDGDRQQAAFLAKCRKLAAKKQDNKGEAK